MNTASAFDVDVAGLAGLVGLAGLADLAGLAGLASLAGLARQAGPELGTSQPQLVLAISGNFELLFSHFSPPPPFFSGVVGGCSCRFILF